MTAATAAADDATPKIQPAAPLALRVLRLLVAAVVAFAPSTLNAAGPVPLNPKAAVTAPIVARPPIARGVNFGNMLEAPREGDWGLTVQASFFDRVRDAGFDHIRLPVSWTHHAALTPPYTIDPAFLARVDWCVDQALSRGLKIIVNVHHYDALNANPAAETPRALAIWNQIATRLAARPDAVLFEVLNEPHGVFNTDPAQWDQYLRQALQTIRQTNPTRWVLAGPVSWNAIGALETFNPPRDHRLCVTVHHYEPFAFTHQGATWVSPVPPVGVSWDPGLTTLASPWQNWSWQTTVQPASGSLRIEHQAGWAGASFHRPAALNAARAIEFRTDRAVSIRVVAERAGASRSIAVQTTPGQVVRFDLPADFPSVDRVSIQNNTPSPVAAYTVTGLRVLTASGQEDLIRTQADDIDAAMARAARWAADRGVPIHLGEFGAYSPAPMPSRQAWTRAVRTAAERHGLPWSYWEFAAGFGVYDPATNTFRGPLVHALTAD